MCRLMSLSLLFVFLAACSQPAPASNSGIYGQATLGPTCPVVQINNPCPDKPYQATLTVLTSSGKKVTRFTTDTDGKFRVPLAPGDYILHPELPANNPFPVGHDIPFTVMDGQYSEVNIIFDSGIR
jgi:hypothetical protein